MSEEDPSPRSQARPASGRRAVLIDLEGQRGAVKDRATTLVGLDELDTLALADVPRYLRNRPDGEKTPLLILAGSPPEEEIGYALLPLVVAALRPKSLALLDGREGTVRWRSPARQSARVLPLAALQLLVSSVAVAAQRVSARRIRTGLEPPSLVRSDELGRVLYLRALVGSSSGVGGAVTHTHGVIRALQRVGIEVDPVTTDVEIARTAASEASPPCTWEIAEVSRAFRLLPAVSAFGGDLALRRAANERAQRADLIYQRHARFSLAGALLSRSSKRPLFLEYNGSEAYLAAASQSTRFSRQLIACEDAMLRTAARVIVVSEIERRTLIERGVDPGSIVVNPNGVDCDQFARGGGGAIRESLGLEDAFVAGFVGSFGPWHGAQVLARAFVRLAVDVPQLRLLLVGDGDEQQATKNILVAAGLQTRSIFVGEVQPGDVPSYLDACDVLVSPHVPLPGGRPFFGSPTKLFEYMAAGKPIVASRLGQIADVLEHERTALLVEPANVEQLAASLERIAGSPALGATLGRNAREQAVLRHSWDRNAERIVEAYGDWAQEPARPAIQ